MFLNWIQLGTTMNLPSLRIQRHLWLQRQSRRPRVLLMLLPARPDTQLISCFGVQEVGVLFIHFLATNMKNSSIVKTTSLLTVKVLAAQHRRGLLKRTIGNDALCGGVIDTTIKKSMYKFSVLFPIPETSRAHVLGRVRSPGARLGQFPPLARILFIQFGAGTSAAIYTVVINYESFQAFSVGFSYFFSTLIFHLSTCSFADQLSDHGRTVQTYAEGIVPKDTPTLSEDGKTVQFGSSSSSNISVNALFPGSDADPDQVIKALQDGADGAISTANDNKKKLYTDSNQPNSTTMGNAYGIARSTLAAPKSVSPTDGFLNRTTGLFSNIDEITESLGNCSSSISYSDAQQTTHVPDLHTCDVIYNPVGSCTIDHNVSVDSYKFTVSVSAQGRARTDAYINFKTGETTYKTDGSGVAIVYSKADYDRICSGRTVDIRFLGAKPRTGLSGRQSLIDGVGVSTSSFFGNPDTTFVAGVNVMPSCENGLKASLFLQDFVTNLDDDKWYMSAEYTFEVVSRALTLGFPRLHR